ncbi:MAG: S-layer homology domain-containing protein [Bacillota bacterium]
MLTKEKKFRFNGRRSVAITLVLIMMLSFSIPASGDSLTTIYQDLKTQNPQYVQNLLDTGSVTEAGIQSFLVDLDTELAGLQLTEENFKTNMLNAVLKLFFSQTYGNKHEGLFNALIQAYPAVIDAIWTGEITPEVYNAFYPLYEVVKTRRLAQSPPPGNNNPPPVVVPVLTTIGLSGSIQTLKIGDTYDLSQLALSGKDQNGSNFNLTGKAVTWNSSNSSIAGISGNTLTAVAAGNTQITAIMEGKTSNEVTVLVAVKPAQPVTSDAAIDQQLAEGASEVKISASGETGTLTVGVSGQTMQKLEAQEKPLVATLGSTQIKVEPGALKVSNSESVVNISAAEIPADQVGQLVAKAGSAFRVGGKVLEIKVEEVNGDQVRAANISGGIEITMSYDAGVDPDNIDIYWYNPGTGGWEPQRAHQIDRANRTISVRVTHLSTWAVMEYRKTFSDIQGYWAQAEIEAMASKHIVNGISAEKFAPLANVTRAEFAAMIVRTLNLKYDTSMVNPFKDVNTGMKLHNEIVTAAHYGLVNGYKQDQFRPSEPISRQQLAALMARALLKATNGQGIAGSEATMSLSPFQDAGKISPQLRNDVALAVQQGIVKGMSAVSFAPGQQATRAQAAVMLKRLYDQLPQVADYRSMN